MDILKTMTGFIAYLTDSNRVVEKNNFFDPHLGRICATNWHLVNQNQIVRLELWWQGSCKVRIEKTPDISEWVFYHTGCKTPGSSFTILSRTIGCVRNGIRTVHTVDENTGLLIY